MVGRGATEEWRRIARGPRPLYHICTWPDIEDWSEDDFYDIGRQDWEDFRDQWSHYAGELTGRCLEVGCGAGRITRQLAEQFDHVVAVDVSTDMIARARRASPNGVEFHQVDDTRLPLADSSIEAAFSVHVFQHLDGFADVERYLSEIRRVLVPGGTLMIHIALGSSEGGIFGRRGLLRRELRLWRSRRALRNGREHDAVRYRLYRWEDVEEVFKRLGFQRIELRMFPVRSNGYPHSFWLATKPS